MPAIPSSQTDIWKGETSLSPGSDPDSSDDDTPPTFSDVTVTAFLSELNKLVNQLDFMDSIKQENAQLRREMDGLRSMFSDLHIAFL